MRMAIKIPMSIFEPGKSLSRPSLGVDTPLAVVGSVYAVLPPAVLMNCLFLSNTQLTMFAAIQLVIIHTITSLTLRKALKSPGISPQIIPQSMPTISASSHIQKAVSGVVGTDKATITDPIAPIRYCPGAPMLKRPVLKAIATDRPVIRSGADSKNMSPRTKVMFLDPPLAKGPARMIVRPLNASDSGILSEVSAKIRRTNHPTKIPAIIQSREEITDFIPADETNELSLFVIMLSPFLTFCARHVKSELLNRCGLWIEFANDFSLVHYKYSIR